MYDREKIIKRVSLLTNEEDLDLIEILVDKAEQTVTTSTFRDSFEPLKEYEGIMDIVEDIACYRYNQIGNEGIKNESMGRNSVSYNDDLPELIQRRINALKIVRFY